MYPWGLPTCFPVLKPDGNKKLLKRWPWCLHTARGFQCVLRWRAWLNNRGLSWDSLQTRREKARLVMLYRVTHGLVDIPLPKDLLPMPYKNTRNFHPKKYRPLACNTNYYMGTFFPSTVNIWNTLPAATLDQPNIAKFKDELDRFYWLYSKMSLTVFIDFIYIYC